MPSVLTGAVIVQPVHCVRCTTSKQCCGTYAGPLKAEALVPFLSAYIKGAAANGSATGSDTAAGAEASKEEPSPEADSGAGNDTTGERPEAPQMPPPDLYDLDLDKVDMLLEDDRVWMIATYAGEPCTGLLVQTMPFTRPVCLQRRVPCHGAEHHKLLLERARAQLRATCCAT